MYRSFSLSGDNSISDASRPGPNTFGNIRMSKKYLLFYFIKS